MSDVVFMALHGENGENGKVQAAAPYNGHIAVYLQHIIIQGDFDQFFLGAEGFQTQNIFQTSVKMDDLGVTLGKV